jgi:hypothetical protein
MQPDGFNPCRGDCGVLVRDVCFATAVLVGLGVLTGCGGTERQRLALEGAVTLDGKPLADGSIRFLAASNTDDLIVGGAIREGTFTIAAEKGAWPGKYRVEIRATRKTGKKAQERNMDQPIEEIVQYLPDRYNLESTLTADVTAMGPNRFEFVLTQRL